MDLVGVLASLLLTGVPVWTPPVPIAPRTPAGHAPRPPGTPTILFVNYDGAVLQEGCGNDPRRDCSTLSALFHGHVGPFTGNQTQKMSILQTVRKRVADFGIDVVVDRPPDSMEYSMVLYGVLGAQDFAGIAPYIDCEDVYRGDTSFSQGFDTSNTGATIVLQEAAHTWGLEHVDDEFDVMNPFKSNYTQVFKDECAKIVANTELDAAPGSCNQVHTKFCDLGFQNSYRELMHLFGPAIPDVQAPSLEIVSPQDGGFYVAPVQTLPLIGRVGDNRHPQYYQATVLRAGETLLSNQVGTIDDLLTVANLQKVPPGEYDLVVQVMDEAGNMAEDDVRFTVLPEGSALPEADDQDDDEEIVDGNGCRSGGRPVGSALLPMVFALNRRRRVACKPAAAGRLSCSTVGTVLSPAVKTGRP